MSDLSDSTANALRAAILAYRREGRAPSRRELAALIKPDAKPNPNNATYHLDRLAEAGFIEYIENPATPTRVTARNYQFKMYPEGDEFTTPGPLASPDASHLAALTAKYRRGENLDVGLIGRVLGLCVTDARGLVDTLLMRDYARDTGKYIILTRHPSGERIRRIGASTTIPVTADIEDARVESTDALVELRVEPDEPTADEVDEYLLWLEGAIAAGEFAEIDTEKELTYLPRVTGPDAAHFLLRVRGLSMLGPPAWIADGDVVVCRRTDTASDGDIVVAVIGEEATLKRFRRVNGGVHLEPLNSAYETIRLTGEDARRLRIQGRAVMIHRPL